MWRCGGVYAIPASEPGQLVSPTSSIHSATFTNGLFPFLSKPLKDQNYHQIDNPKYIKPRNLLLDLKEAGPVGLSIFNIPCTCRARLRNRTSRIFDITFKRSLTCYNSFFPFFNSTTNQPTYQPACLKTPFFKEKKDYGPHDETIRRSWRRQAADDAVLQPPGDEAIISGQIGQGSCLPVPRHAGQDQGGGERGGEGRREVRGGAARPRAQRKRYPLALATP